MTSWVRNIPCKHFPSRSGKKTNIYNVIGRLNMYNAMEKPTWSKLHASAHASPK